MAAAPASALMGATSSSIHPSPSERRIYWTLTVALVAAAVHAWAVREHFDFLVFHLAAHRAWLGQPLYLEADANMPFKYAPVVALLLSPLGLLPLSAAKLLWLVSSGFLMARFAWTARAIVAPKLGGLWTVAAVVLVGPFFLHMLRLGQIDILILALAAESERLSQKRPWLSGALLGLCCAIKLPFLLLPALAFFQREGRRLAAFAVCGIGLLLLPALRYGWMENFHLISRWRAILQMTTTEALCSADNQSVFGIVCQYIVPPGHPLFSPIAMGLGAVLAGSLLTAGILLRASEERRRFAWAGALYLTAVLSPLGWRTNLVAMAPLFMFALERLKGGPKWVYWGLMPAAMNAFLGFTAFEVLGRPGYLFLIDYKVFGMVAAAAALGAAFTAAALDHPQH